MTYHQDDIQAPKSRAAKRAMTAGRTRKWRNKRRQAGVPEARDVDRAVSESVSFILGVVVSTLGAPPHIDAAALFRIAVINLVRDGYDREQAKVAMRLRLGVRDEHESSTYVPSSNPSPSTVTIQPRGGQAFKDADIQFIRDFVASHSDPQNATTTPLPLHTA